MTCWSASRRSSEDACVPTRVPGLDIVPATVDLSGAEIELIEFEARTHRLDTAIVRERTQRWDVVLIDCPPSLGLLTINAMVAADALLVPLQCEFFALEGLSQLLNTVERIRSRFNPGLSILGVVLTMYDRRNRLTDQVSDDVRAVLGRVVFDTVIPRNVRLSEAPSHGLPALIYDHRCAGSEAYIALAREVIERLPKLSEGRMTDEPTPSAPRAQAALGRGPQRAARRHCARGAGRRPGDAPAPAACACSRSARLRRIPNQPRRHFDEDALDELAESIAARGLIQPIVVRPHGTAIRSSPASAAGARPSARGCTKSRSIVRDFDDAETLEIALDREYPARRISTRSRRREAYQRLIGEFGHTQEALAQDRPQVAQPCRQPAAPARSARAACASWWSRAR